MAVGQRAAARSPCPARPETSGRTLPAMIVPIEVTATPAAAGGLRERLERDSPGPRTESRNRRRRKRWSSMPTVPRASKAAAAARQRNARRIDHGGHAGGRAELCEIAGEAVGDVHRRTAHGREPPAPARCAAAARGSARPAVAVAAASSASAAATAPPLRISRPSAASPIVPVTTTRSPGLAPLRWTILPAGTRPNAVIEIISGPGVETVSPPSSGQPNCAGVLAKPRANGVEPGIVGARAAPASARSRRASRPWRRDRTGSPAAPCARWCRADRRRENARLRRWRPSSPRCRRRTRLRTAASSPRPNAPGSVASGLK